METERRKWWECPVCGEAMSTWCDLTISLPTKYHNHISKKVLRKKEVRLWGLRIEEATVRCVCGYIDRGLPRYIENLVEARLKELKELTP